MAPRRVTFSRNLTLSLSRTCVSHCKYCAFATHRAHLHEPAEVERLLDHAARRRVKELLVLTGDDPAHHPGVRDRLAALGFEDFVAYVAWCCERALERGILPHTNLGALSHEDLARLREVTASQGLMLESMRPDLVAHQGSPTKDPALRLDTIRAAGELRIPFTSGILVGIGETEGDRVEALEALAAAHAEYGHLQEVILQNFVPHRRYYGEEPAEIADEAQRSGTAGAPLELPSWATEVTLDHMRTLVRECRRLMPDVGIQIPPNLSDWWLPLVDEGATDLGGLSANGDHISPEHPFPSVHEMRKRLAPRGQALAERLCVYPQYMSADWLEQGVLDVIKVKYWSFIPRSGSGRREERQIRHDLVPGAVERAADGDRLSEEELTALFAETRPEAIEDMRQAADSLRAELAGDTVTFVVNRNINVSNVCTVGCAFCGFGQGRRSPDAYEHSEEEFRRRVREAIAFGATEICMQSGIHPDWTLVDYERWLRIAKDEAPHIHLHAYSPMELHFMAGELPLAEVFDRLKDAGLGSTPGTAAEVLHDGVRQRISPNKLPVARWIEIIEAAHAAGVRSTVTVMFGHIEEPWELAEHMRVVRELQERTGGFTEFVPLSFIPFHTLLGRTHGIEEISREDNLRHTAAFRLALGRTIPSLQASWVKMGLDAATEALDWGVNDLGGTLMEESISRLAGSYHGVKLEPADLIGAAHAAGRPAAERDTLYGIRKHYPLFRGRVKLGYKASAEQFGPVELLDFARHAEEIGLEIIAVSDHFQPWRHHGGHGPNALTWLGAAAVATERAVLGTSVLTPTLRYHPSVVAQAFGTLGRLAPGRVFLGVGTGEAMNETPATGQEFPGRKERRQRLAEAIKLIRALWTEERVDFDGEWYRTEKATIYDKPDEPVPIYVAASGPLAAKLAGRVGDGFICTSGKDPELYDKLLASVAEGAEQAGRDPAEIRRMIEVKVNYDRDREYAVQGCNWWAALALTPEQKEGVDDPLEMERLADENIDRAPSRFIVSDDPEEMAAGIRHYADLGFEELVLHAPGQDQRRFLDEFAEDVLPLLT